jgi:hypothetical protein
VAAKLKKKEGPQKYKRKTELNVRSAMIGMKKLEIDFKLLSIAFWAL